MHQKTVLHFIKTKSILSDGRLLKWIDSLEGVNIKSKIVVLENKITKSTIFQKKRLRISTENSRIRIQMLSEFY